MAERAGLRPLVTSVPAFFRHHDRTRDQTAESDAPSSERGFMRVSGRKLPSAFSPGMSSSPPPSMPLTSRDRNLSNTSFYRDSSGFYGGEGDLHSGAGSGLSDEYEGMTLSPGPQRKPTVHTGGPFVMSPPGLTSPVSPSSMPNTPILGTPVMRSATPASPANTFGRSDTPSSMDGNRSSRFTEEV
jgi:hypothetical protein